MTNADFAGKHYWEGGLMNSLRSVSATYVGNIKQDNKTVSDPAALKDDRFSFDVSVGGETLTIAYDYHVNKDSQGNKFGIFEAIQEKLKNTPAGGALTIKGTFRFAGPVQKSYKGNEGSTTWNLVPFELDHIA